MTKLNLILDLDETLITTIVTSEVLSCDYYFILDNIRYNVYLRPYLINFLIEISKYYNLILYTNALEDYTVHIIDYINKCINQKDSYTHNIYKAAYCRYPHLSLTKTLERVQYYDNSINNTNTLIIDDNLTVWPNIYHSILYNIPPFKVNFEDNILNDLLDDLYVYYIKYNKQNIVDKPYKLLKFGPY